jgi:DNA-binding transcriptional ArsR family regulator
LARRVISFELEVADMAATRFTISPLHETVASLFPLYVCDDRFHSGWTRDIHDRSDLDHELLSGLISPACRIPDFVTPAPTRSRPTFSEQLSQLRETTPEMVYGDVRAAYGDSPLPRALTGVEHDPAALRDDIAAALARYWTVAIAPHWQRMNAILEADVLYRGLRCAQIGAGAAYNEIDPQIRWHEGTLTVDIVESWNKHVPVAGRVMQLAPSVFTPSPTLPISSDLRPVLSYRSRRSGLLWHEVTPAASSAIRGLLGPRRAGLLLALDQPRSTTELAHQTTVTPSAISQHLRVLSAAGLVNRARVGRVVLYSQSELGRQLLDGTGSLNLRRDVDPGLLGNLSA